MGDRQPGGENLLYPVNHSPMSGPQAKWHKQMIRLFRKARNVGADLMGEYSRRWGTAENAFLLDPTSRNFLGNEIQWDPLE